MSPQPWTMATSLCSSAARTSSLPATCSRRPPTPPSTARGGSIQGVIDGLNHIIDLTIPSSHEEGGTYVIPGHGRLTDEADVVEYRDMATIVRDRIQALARRGQTLEQIKSARPTLDYDGRYGSPDAFIDAIFRK